jgi:hypothetical protein
MGTTVRCPKPEGTCNQPDHLTKEQVLALGKNKANGILLKPVDISDDNTITAQDYLSFGVERGSMATCDACHQTKDLYEQNYCRECYDRFKIEAY